VVPTDVSPKVVIPAVEEFRGNQNILKYGSQNNYIG